MTGAVDFRRARMRPGADRVRAACATRRHPGFRWPAHESGHIRANCARVEGQRDRPSFQR